MFPHLDKKGISLLEIVVVLGAFGLVIVSMAGTMPLFYRRVSSNALETKAHALAAETMEALRFVKENNWKDLSDLTPGAVYFLSVGKDPHRWVVTSVDPGKVDSVFSRSFTVQQVNRDAATGRIAPAGGELDEETMLAEVNVNWADRDRGRNIVLQTYLANH